MFETQFVNLLCEPDNLECFSVGKSAKNVFPVLVLLEKMVLLSENFEYWLYPKMRFEAAYITWLYSICIRCYVMSTNLWVVGCPDSGNGTYRVRDAQILEYHQNVGVF